MRPQSGAATSWAMENAAMSWPTVSGVAFSFNA
jgi:hypothetical protein